MFQNTPRRRGRRALAALAVAVGLATVGALAAPAGALIGPSPAPSNTTTLTFTTPITGLAPGQTVTYHADTAAASLTKVDAKLCATGFSSYGGTTFGYDGASGVRCVYAPTILSGGLAGIQSGYRNLQSFSGTQHSGNLNFNAGTGVVTWNNNTGDGPNTLTCDKTNPCDMVYEVGLQGDSVPSTFFIQPLTFAGTPDAPTISNVTAGNTSATVTYNLLAAGLPSGNGTINQYTVTAQPHTYGAGACPGSGDVHSVNVTTGFGGVGTPVTGNSAAVTGLTNFCNYDFTVAAQTVASNGTLHFDGAASAASLAMPSSSGPSSLTGAPGDHSVNLNWSAASGSVTDYQINVSPAPPAGPCTSGACTSAGTGTSFNVTGLTNGQPYTFTVQAVLTGGFLSTLSPSTTVTPNAALIHQTITIAKPSGQLVLSQYCSGLPVDETGAFDPSNTVGLPIPNTNCDISLSGPRTSKIQNNAITTTPRTVTDATTDGSTTIVSATAAFTAAEVNQLVVGDGIANGTRIASVTDATHAVLTANASTSLIGGVLTIQGVTVNFGTVAGFTLTPDAAGYSTGTHVGHQINGNYIPGGSTISAVVNDNAIDISQPTNGTSFATTTREWLTGVTAPKLVTSGPHAGQYLQADGVLNQVYIVDYRPADTGWTVTGQMAAFSDGASHTFSGDALGWQPRVATASTVLAGYNSLVSTAGGVVQPATTGGLGTGTTTSTDSLQPGSAQGRTLAFANSGSGLGLARLDALLSLAVPLHLPAGTYTGILTLTAI